MSRISAKFYFDIKPIKKVRDSHVESRGVPEQLPKFQTRFSWNAISKICVVHILQTASWILMKIVTSLAINGIILKNI